MAFDPDDPDFRAAQGLPPTYENQYGAPPARPLLPQPVEWGGAMGKIIRIGEYVRIAFAVFAGLLFVGCGCWLLTDRSTGANGTIYGLILFGLVLLGLAYFRFRRLR